MARDDRRRRVPFAGIVNDPGMTGEGLEEALGEDWAETIEQDRDSPPSDTALLSEPSLAEDWLRPEEDEVWRICGRLSSTKRPNRMPTLELDLPPEIFSALRRTPRELGPELRLAAAIHWYSKGRLSQESEPRSGP